MLGVNWLPTCSYWRSCSTLSLLQPSWFFLVLKKGTSCCSWPLLCTFQIEPTREKMPKRQRPTACHEQRWTRAVCDDLSFRSMLLHRCLTKNERVIRKVCAKTMQIRCSLWHPNKRYVLYILWKRCIGGYSNIPRKLGKLCCISCGLNWMHWLYY